jgi:hypothetical protein
MRRGSTRNSSRREMIQRPAPAPAMFNPRIIIAIPPLRTNNFPLRQPQTESLVARHPRPAGRGRTSVFRWCGLESLCGDVAQSPLPFAVASAFAVVFGVAVVFRRSPLPLPLAVILSAAKDPSCRRSRRCSVATQTHLSCPSLGCNQTDTYLVIWCLGCFDAAVVRKLLW